jgi:hypothetical protein
MSSNLQTDSIEFLRYPVPLRLSLENYHFAPTDMDSFKPLVAAVHSLMTPVNSDYGRGFVQIAVGNVIKSKKIYDTSQFNMALLKHMMEGVMVNEGPTAGSSPVWGRTNVLVTLCREYLPNTAQSPATRVISEKGGEGSY